MRDQHLHALTDRQQQVLSVIDTYVEEHGYSPTLREIGARTGLRSASSVQRQVTILHTHGYLRRRPGCPRTLELLAPTTREHPGDSLDAPGPTLQ